MKLFSNLKRLVPLFILIAIGYFLVCGLNSNPTLVPSSFINKHVPEFNLESVQDPNVQLNNKVFLGKVSLLNVWATWCSTCAAEYPFMMDIAATHKVNMVGLDYKDDRGAVLKWIKQYGNPFETLGFDSTGSVAIDWGVYGTPESFIIDKSGMIRYKIVGAITPSLWQNTLVPLIDKLNAQAA